MIEIETKINENFSYEEKIRNIFRKSNPISRQILSHELGIDPRNLNRTIKPLIKSGELKKGPKSGREVIYFWTPHEKDEETPNEPPIDTQAFKIHKSKHKYIWQRILDLLEREGREMWRTEIAEKLKIRTGNLDRSLNIIYDTKQVIRRVEKRRIYYRLPDVPFSPKENQKVTKLEVLVDRIEPLKAVLQYHRDGLEHSNATTENIARQVTKFYLWKSGKGTRFDLYPPERFTIQDVTDYIDWLKKQNYGSITQAKSCLKTYFRDLKRLKYTPENIMEGIPLKKAKRNKGVDIDQAEFQQMLKAAPTVYEKTVLTVLLDTGVRRIEAERMNLEDVDFKNCTIVIHAAKMRLEENPTRTIDLSPFTVQKIREYIDTVRAEPVGDDEDAKTALFVNPFGNQRLKKHAISSLVRKLRIKAGIEAKVTTHSMRRASARMLLERGMPISGIMDRLGHTVEATTWGYINQKKGFLTAQYRRAQAIKTPDQPKGGELMQELLKDCF